MKGQIYIEAVVDNEPAILSSEDLIIFLNETEATFKYILDPATLKGLNGESQQRLNQLENKIVIEGFLEMQRIPQTSHEPMRVDVQASTSGSEMNELAFGEANLRYMHSQWFDTLLKMNLTIKKGMLGIASVLNITSDEIHITIKHPVIHQNI